MTEEGRQPTVSELETEISETKKDLDSFVQARDLIRRRVREQTDYPIDGRVLPTIVEWSGTDAVLGSLDLSIHSLERVLGELTEKLQQTVGRRTSTFRVITGGADDKN
jgi:hypothetical protein